MVERRAYCSWYVSQLYISQLMSLHPLIHRIKSEVCFNSLTGSRFKDAFQDPVPYLAVEPLFQVEPFELKRIISNDVSPSLCHTCILIMILHT